MVYGVLCLAGKAMQRLIGPTGASERTSTEADQGAGGRSSKVPVISAGDAGIHCIPDSEAET
jgi:hypothetical protein